MKRPKSELFEYLAYNGVKNQKVYQYEQIKKENDLQGCTF